jgi:HEAT repeat protein
MSKQPIGSILSLVVLAVVSPATGTLNAGEPDRIADEQLLRKAGLGTDGPALVDLFHKRARATGDREEIRVLVAQLSDEAPAKRDKACAELIALGVAAVPYLREAARHPDDRELLAQTRRCLDFIDGPNNVPLMVAATRLLAQRRPAQAVETLLQFLPMAENDNVLGQIRRTLLELALRDGEPEPALLDALDDRLSLRRAVAAEVLSQLGRKSPDARLRKLLRDPAAGVRLHVAIALGRSRDEAAIAELIQLLGELPTRHARMAEESLFELAEDQSPQVPLGDDEASRKECRAAWAAWWKGTAGDALLGEFARRMLSAKEREEVRVLIQKLGDKSFKVRESSMAALSKMSYLIAPLLRQSLNSPDLELRGRVEKCLEAVEPRKHSIPPLSPVTARLVALRRPPGSVETLLAFLTDADEDATLDEVRAALAAIALRGGQPHPVLVEGLQDKLPRRRASAAAALATVDAREHFPAIRKMLQDADPGVRLEVALALAGAGERAAVPVLIALLAESSRDRALRIDDYLRTIAGDRSPAVVVGGGEAERKKAHDAWAAWWAGNADAVSLTAGDRPAPRGPRGYTLVVLPDPGQVLELGVDGKVRWQITGVNGSLAAQVLSNDRVLIAETRTGRVSERSTRGEVLWETRLNSPVGCQRLPNGKTLIVTPGALVEVDRAGKEVWKRPINKGEGANYIAAVKMRNGQIVCATAASLCLVLDATGTEIRRFPLRGTTNFNCLEVLPHGRILVASLMVNKVTEHDLEGKVVWEATVVRPTHATRLPNGNTLVSRENPGQVLELDRNGTQVWEYSAPNQTRVLDVKRR